MSQWSNLLVYNEYRQLNPFLYTAPTMLFAQQKISAMKFGYLNSGEAFSLKFTTLHTRNKTLILLAASAFQFQ